MTDDNADGPAPEDLNHPDTLRITISSPEGAFAGAISDAADAESDEQRDAVVSFETAEGLRRLLTDRRLELLRSLMAEPAASISKLAERLNKSYSVVHEDVEVFGEVRYRGIPPGRPIEAAVRSVRDYRVRRHGPRARDRRRHGSPALTSPSPDLFALCSGFEHDPPSMRQVLGNE